MANNFGAATDYTNMPAPNTSVLDTIRGIFGVRPGGADSPTGPLPFRPGVGLVDRFRGALGVPAGGFEGTPATAAPRSAPPLAPAASTGGASGSWDAPAVAAPKPFALAPPPSGDFSVTPATPAPGLGAVPATATTPAPRVTYDASGKRTVTIGDPAQNALVQAGATGIVPGTPAAVAAPADTRPDWQKQIDYGVQQQKEYFNFQKSGILDYLKQLQAADPMHRGSIMVQGAHALSGAGGANNFGAIQEQALASQRAQQTQLGVESLRLGPETQRANTEQYKAATDSIPTGTVVGTDPVTGMAVPLTTYGQRPAAAGALPTPYTPTPPAGGSPALKEGARITVPNEKGVRIPGTIHQGKFVPD